MNELDGIEEEELHAFIDGELTGARNDAVAAAVAADPDLARRVARFRTDKQRMAEIFGPLADRPLPAAWISKIEGETSRKRVFNRPWMIALAASIMLVLVGIGAVLMMQTGDTILADAAAAYDGAAKADLVLSEQTLPDETARNQVLRTSLGMPVRAPDLTKFGYSLAALDIFRRPNGETAAGLVYHRANAADLMIYIRKSSGSPRFDLLRRGKLRVCIWQDDVVGAVITGDMSAGEMNRIAVGAYADLDL